MRSGKVVLGVVGSVLALFGIALLVAGGVLLVVFGTQRDPDGFFTSDAADVSTDSYALTSTQMDLGGLRNDWFPASWLATIQLEASPESEAPVFVGIGPREDVSDYLQDVAHDEVIEISNSEATYRSRDGEAQPGLPSGQEFWTASTEGPGSQSLVWDIEPGQWTIVIMNADASPGLAADVSAGARSPWFTVGIGVLLIGGFLSAGVGAIVLIFAFRRPRAVAAEMTSPPPQPVGTVSTGAEDDTA